MPAELHVIHMSQHPEIAVAQGNPQTSFSELIRLEDHDLHDLLHGN